MYWMANIKVIKKAMLRLLFCTRTLTIILSVAIGLVLFQGCSFSRKESPQEYNSTVIVLRQLKKSIDSYKVKCGSNPSTIDELMKSLQDGKCAGGKQSLVGEVTSSKDLWGNPIFYLNDGGKYRLISCGAEWLQVDSDSKDISLPIAYVQKGRLLKEKD